MLSLLVFAVKKTYDADDISVPLISKNRHECCVCSFMDQAGTMRTKLWKPTRIAFEFFISKKFFYIPPCHQSPCLAPIAVGKIVVDRRRRRRCHCRASFHSGKFWLYGASYNFLHSLSLGRAFFRLFSLSICVTLEKWSPIETTCAFFLLSLHLCLILVDAIVAALNISPI